nr:uncharacterized protein LOC112800871 isoform X3 [Arachis hypogaea]
MCLADLEFDYINAYDSSSRINMVVLPEFIIQALLTSFYLVNSHWILTLLSLPYLCFNLHLDIQQPVLGKEAPPPQTHLSCFLPFPLSILDDLQLTRLNDTLVCFLKSMLRRMGNNHYYPKSKRAP